MTATSRLRGGPTPQRQRCGLRRQFRVDICDRRRVGGRGSRRRGAGEGQGEGGAQGGAEGAGGDRGRLPGPVHHQARDPFLYLPDPPAARRPPCEPERERRLRLPRQVRLLQHRRPLVASVVEREPRVVRESAVPAPAPAASPERRQEPPRPQVPPRPPPAPRRPVAPPAPLPPRRTLPMPRDAPSGPVARVAQAPRCRSVALEVRLRRPEPVAPAHRPPGPG